MKKRICFIGPYPPPYGGMAIQLKKLVENLSREGLEITLIKANQTIPKIFDIKGVRTSINFFCYFFSLFKKIPNVDIIYIFGASHLYFFLIVTPAVLFGNLFRKKVFVNYRGGGPQNFFAKYRSFIRFVLERSCIIVPSEYLQKIFKEYLDLDSNIIPNFTYLDDFRYRERKNLKPFLLCTRNFQDIYDIPCVVKAFNMVVDIFPNAKLGLVGDGPEKDKILKLIKKLKLQDKVKVYGRIIHNKLPKIYDQYDIFINASKIDNFPGSILEAFSAGLPVISTNVGGIPYIVKDNITGLLIDSGDYKNLAQKTVYLLKNPEIAQKISKEARKIAELYKWDKVKKKLLSILLEENL